MRKRTPPIPRDEMLLAEAIAAAKARGLKHCTGVPFEGGKRGGLSVYGAHACCAVGALVLAGKATLHRDKGFAKQPSLSMVTNGNDYGFEWEDGADRGESLGWAFRCAMTQEEP